MGGLWVRADGSRETFDFFPCHFHVFLPGNHPWHMEVNKNGNNFFLLWSICLAVTSLYKPWNFFNLSSYFCSFSENSQFFFKIVKIFSVVFFNHLYLVSWLELQVSQQNNIKIAKNCMKKYYFPVPMQEKTFSRLQRHGKGFLRHRGSFWCCS